MQKTLKNSVEISGIGLHSGCPSRLVIMPAPENTGIVFIRTDLASNNHFAALYSEVVDTRNCTCLGNANRQIVSTIEHIMAALYAVGIDNAFIKINNPEVPIMDGSAKIFYEVLRQAELVDLPAKRKYLQVKKTVEFVGEKGGSIRLSAAPDLTITADIDFPSPIVGYQKFSAVIDENLFAKIAPARTFCEKYQVTYLQSIGLIKGGSLDNAVVLDGDKILNEGGFRFEDECVKHKVLDCIGDMFTSGYRLRAKVEASCSGHFHNNEVLKLLFADKSNYEITEE